MLKRRMTVCFYFNLDHWIHETEDNGVHIMGRMTRWLRDSDGVHNLLTDRNELGTFSY